MKRFLVILFIMGILTGFMCGCDGGGAIKVNHGIKVKIERSVSTATDPWVEIACSYVSFNYDKREIIIEQPISFRGDDGGFLGSIHNWVVPKIEIVNNNLIINFPDDTPFHLYLGKQYHFLPVIIKEKKGS